MAYSKLLAYLSKVVNTNKISKAATRGRERGLTLANDFVNCKRRNKGNSIKSLIETRLCGVEGNIILF